MPGLHKGAIGKWPFLPRYLQEAFIRSFSRELLTDPGRRIIDQKWLQLFIRLRGEIFKCPCGEVYFADPVNPNPCPECGKKNQFSAYIKTPRYNVPPHHRTRLYAWHTEVEKDYRAHPFSGEEIAAAAEKYQKRYRGGQQLYRAYGTTLIAGTTKSTSRGSTAP